MDDKILQAEQDEIIGYKVYTFLSNKSKGENKETIYKIAQDELKHYNYLKEITKKDLSANSFTLFFYRILAFLFGVTFVIKLFEKREINSADLYSSLKEKYPNLQEVEEDEERHEQELIALIEEERLNYVSSIVLGLNDALVEITGTIAGLTSALQNSKAIGVSALITGVAASLSMAASEYISKKVDVSTERNPLKSSTYTFIAYFVAVLLLVLPFFFISNYYIDLVLSIVIGFVIILVFSFYISIVQDRSFNSIFLQMFLIVIGVVAVTFLLGYISRKLFNINVWGGKKCLKKFQDFLFQ